MADLAQWMRAQLDRHNMTQVATSVHARVSPATISDILNKGPIPGCEVLYRLTVAWGDRAPLTDTPLQPCA